MLRGGCGPPRGGAIGAAGLTALPKEGGAQPAGNATRRLAPSRRGWMGVSARQAIAGLKSLQQLSK